MAAISTYATLKNFIDETLGRSLDAAVYQTVTNELNRDLRLQVMEATTTLAEAETIDLPDDFIEVISVYRDADPRTVLTPKPVQNIHQTYYTSGNPRHYAIADDLMLLDRPGSGNIEMRYYAKLAQLVADDDVNDFLTEQPNLYIYGALFHGAALRGDERAGLWGQQYAAAKRAAQVNSDTGRQGPAMDVTAPGSTP